MDSVRDLPKEGFPHSDICGSTIARISPQLFAACHVLHRLLAPRHPPNALITLTITSHRPHAVPNRAEQLSANDSRTSRQASRTIAGSCNSKPLHSTTRLRAPPNQPIPYSPVKEQTTRGLSPKGGWFWKPDQQIRAVSPETRSETDAPAAAVPRLAAQGSDWLRHPSGGFICATKSRK